MDRIHKYYEVLELNKILALLSEKTCCEAAAYKVKNIVPCTDYFEVCSEIEKTKSAFDLSSKYGTPGFVRFSDPKKAVKRAQSGSSLNTVELLNIAKILRQSKSLLNWIEQCANIESPLKPLFNSLSAVRELEHQISISIISEDEIDDNASAELAYIRKKMNNLRLKARDALEKMVKSPSVQKFLQDQIITIRNGRFVIPVKAEYKNEINGLVHDYSASGSTLFIEPTSIVNINNEIRVLENKEKAEIERILLLLSADVAAHSNEIINDFDSIIDINIYFAKSEFAASQNAYAPNITDNGEIKLKKARHPLIDKNRVIPIDVELGYKFDSLIITGPNTGGKTVTLKTIGLLTLMTMCGMLIPAAEGSSISVFSKILVDIGDEQSIEQNLSTFSAHMKNTISILNEADSNSLILLDELGSGTDPVEGAALAVSILEQFKNCGAKVAATTHYQELKIYALQTDRVENASCEFDIENLKPTYKLILGAPGRSNAFAISGKLGLDRKILSNAEKLIENEDKQFEKVISDLDTQRKEFEKKTAELDAKMRELSKEKNELEIKLNKFEKQKQNEMEEAKEKARKIVEDVRLRSDALFAEIDELKKQKNKHDFAERAARAKSQIKSEAGKLYNEANPVQEIKNTGYKLPRPLKSGDSVLVVDIDKNATVITPTDKSGNVFVQIGLFKMRVKEKNLKLIEQKNKYTISGKTVKSVRNKAERNVKTEIDLRGLTAEEAIMELDNFIDGAVMSGVNIINIIHGKGTGVLKKAVAEHLKHHPSIKSSRLGVYGEGEDGVTIAELK